MSAQPIGRRTSIGHWRRRGGCCARCRRQSHKRGRRGDAAVGSCRGSDAKGDAEVANRFMATMAHAACSWGDWVYNLTLRQDRGSGLMISALQHVLPLVIMPLGADQPANTMSLVVPRKL